MRIRIVTLYLLAILWPAFAHASGQTYYLALGDSLAVGAQPVSPVPGPNNALQTTPNGYANDIFNQLSKQNASLQLKELGCIGETTGTMIQGGICGYADGSQLNAAIDFLENNQVSLITLDIGANDIDSCISTSGINNRCVFGALVRVGGDLSYILGQLRRAAGPNVPIIGMNYYDPFLGAWLLGPAGQAIAIQSLEATDLFNGVLDSVYHAFGVPVANVARAFEINNFVLVPGQNVPLNVALTLKLTFVGFGITVANVHPTTDGYAQIAAAFLAQIE